MSKQIVNEDEFIVMCNQELQKHPEYKEVLPFFFIDIQQF